MIRISNALTARRDSLKNDDKGFTLIELLVVVLIIGVLAAIAIPIFLGQQASAKESAAQQDVSSAKTAVIAQMVSDPTVTIAGIGDLSDFTKSENVNITLTPASGGVQTGFCIQANAIGSTATFVADAKTGVKEGTCTGGAITP